MLSLAALILTAIMTLMIVAHYLDLKREEEENHKPDLSPKARLAEFERAFYAGQMNAEEFQRIKAALENPNPTEILRPSKASKTDSSLPTE